MLGGICTPEYPDGGLVGVGGSGRLDREAEREAVVSDLAADAFEDFDAGGFVAGPHGRYSNSIRLIIRHVSQALALQNIAMKAPGVSSGKPSAAVSRS